MLRLIDPGSSSAGSHPWMSLARCPRQYALSHRPFGGEAPLGPTPKRFIPGQMVHTGVAHWMAERLWRRGLVDSSMTAEDHLVIGDDEFSIVPTRSFITVFMDPIYAVEALASRREADNPYDRGAWVPYVKQCQDTVAAFIASGVGSAFIPIAVEKEYEVQLEGVGRYTARIDCTMIDPDTGLVYFVDWKTSTSTISGAALTGYSLSFQMVGQWYIGEAIYGERFGGVIIGAIQTQPAWASLLKPLIEANQYGRLKDIAAGLAELGYSASESTISKELSLIGVEKTSKGKGGYYHFVGGDVTRFPPRQMEMFHLIKPVRALESFENDMMFWFITRETLKSAYGTDYANYPRAATPTTCADRYSICPFAASHCYGEELEVVFGEDE